MARRRYLFVSISVERLCGFETQPRLVEIIEREKEGAWKEKYFTWKLEIALTRRSIAVQPTISIVQPTNRVNRLPSERMDS